MDQQTQQPDLFTQRRFELIVEMATKKLQQEVNALKEYVSSLNSEMGSLKSQISRLQFQQQPQQAHSVQRTLADSQSEVHFQQAQQNIQPQKEVKIVDCRPDNERRESFHSVERERADRTHVGAAKNSEPIKPRYGDYKPEDVSIDKFFYFGRK